MLQFQAIETEEKCQNCGLLLEEYLITYCSSKCQYENYLKSQTGHICPQRQTDSIQSKFFIFHHSQKIISMRQALHQCHFKNIHRLKTKSLKLKLRIEEWSSQHPSIQKVVISHSVGDYFLQLLIRFSSFPKSNLEF